MSRFLLCIDDTDDISKQTSTGMIAELIAAAMKESGVVITEGVTRHQLLLDRNIEYTSHNSSMCIEAEGIREQYADIWETAVKILNEHSVSTSNPGMAFCIKESLNKDQEKLLIDFGRRAKKEVLTLEEAAETARLSGVRLNAFGGTGAGQIGALAGIGLRLSGNDGTFRGKIKVSIPEQLYSCAELKNILPVYDIVGSDGAHLGPEEKIRLKKQIKLAYLNYKKVLVVKQVEGQIWQACEKADLYEKEKNLNEREGCIWFQTDNDLEEELDHNPGCSNCLFRRWTEQGMECIRKQEKT